MLKKFSFLFFLVLDVYFTVSGLLFLKTPGEAIFGFLFLVLIWYVTWSVYRVAVYFIEKKEGNFIRYYFSYLLEAFETFGQEAQLGPTKFFRIAITSLSLLVGVSTIFFLLYYNISITIFTEELLSRYAQVFLYISIYPLLIEILRTIASRGTMKELVESFFKFFSLRFTQLFIYIGTFLSPILWFIIVFLAYIIAKGKEVQKEKLETVNVQ